jgi:hypothetical protein
MKKYTVNEILNINSGELLLAKDILNLDVTKIFEIRRKMIDDIRNKQKEYVCAICKQPVRLKGGINYNKNSRDAYFAHNKDSADCPIKTDATQNEKERITKIYLNIKESIEHIKIKNWLKEILCNDNRFSNISTEKVVKGIGDEKEWRRPDVQFDFNGKKYVIEIQLSNTFLNVIAARESFYKTNDIPILWIFSNFNPGFIHFFEYDIFIYHNCNAFIFDEETYKLSIKEKKIIFKVIYFIPKLVENKIVPELIKKPVYIDFFEIIFQNGKAYYFDYIKEKNKILLYESFKNYKNININTEEIKNILNNLGIDQWHEYKDLHKLRILICSFISINKKEIYGYKGKNIVWLLNIVYENFTDVFWLIIKFVNNNPTNIKFVRDNDKNGTFQRHVMEFRNRHDIQDETKYSEVLSKYFPEIIL